MTDFTFNRRLRMSFGGELLRGLTLFSLVVIPDHRCVDGRVCVPTDRYYHVGCRLRFTGQWSLAPCYV